MQKLFLNCKSRSIICHHKQYNKKVLLIMRSLYVFFFLLLDHKVKSLCWIDPICCTDTHYSWILQVLVCGDLRGNLILFPLSKGLLLDTPAAPETKIFPLTYFKGAHGISTVSSICISKLSSNEIEICSVWSKLQCLNMNIITETLQVF